MQHALIKQVKTIANIVLILAAWLSLDYNNIAGNFGLYYFLEHMIYSVFYTRERKVTDYIQ